MFDTERFVADCRAAFAEDPTHKAVREVLASAVSSPTAVLKGLGEPTRAEIQKLFHSNALTIIKVVWAPGMMVMPHNHRMWAIIGIYTGREDKCQHVYHRCPLLALSRHGRVHRTPRGGLSTTSGIGQFAVIQSVAPSNGIDVVPINVRDAGEVERAITAFARSPTGGLIVTSSARVAAHADLIVALAARYRLPTVYNRRSYPDAGGLISYGSNTVELARLATGYVDRILKGEKPADLPVQAPTKYELVVNLKTAKTLGLTIPPAVLARADT
jgi:hypothetical protein